MSLTFKFLAYKYINKNNIIKYNVLKCIYTWIEVSMADTSYVGLHLFCNISRHIPPSAYTLGWNIFDTNLTVGALFGYSSVNSIVNLNVPSSNGVSCGLETQIQYGNQSIIHFKQLTQI